LGLAIAGLAGAGMIAWFTITESIHPHPAYWRGWTYLVLAIGVMGAAAATLIAADRFPGLNSRLRPAASPGSPAAQRWISRAVRLPLVFIG